jgi:hypothetical protein
VDVRLELSKNFFKKLQRLDLIEECQQDKEDELTLQKSMRGLQRTGSLSLQYLTNRDPDI